MSGMETCLVNIGQEGESVIHFRLDLVHGAENVSIVLLEPTDSSEASQRSRQLVSVEHAEIG